MDPKMPNNLTDNEIKKALECCMESSHCSKCPFVNILDIRICTSKMSELALDLINQLETKNSNLTSDLTSLQNDLTSLKAENESLKNAYKQCAWERDTFQEENERLSKITLPLIAEIKAEAYTEFAERLKKESYERIDLTAYVEVSDIDNLLKEMIKNENLKE
jgi:FtsZ-binding cell division protein ZapB